MREVVENIMEESKHLVLTYLAFGVVEARRCYCLVFMYLLI